MKRERYIQDYIHIKKGKITSNGNMIFKDESASFSEFIKAAYRHSKTAYPKFFKMDNLSKLGFLAADILLKHNTEVEEEQNIGVVFSNKASSLDTDRNHQNSINDRENYYPSPAVFVYTLPNICIGEISIKHKLYSENSFFIFDHFNAKHLFDATNGLLDLDKAEKVLCGWIDFDKDDYEAFLYLVADKGDIIHKTKEINRLYTL